MALRASVYCAVVLAAACCADQARADVLEIDAGGEARWIAGPLLLVAPDNSDGAAAVQTALALPVPEHAIPEQAVADLAASGSAIPAAYVAVVAQLAQRFDLSPALIEALVWQESRWRANAVSPAGARGLAQLMPGTARYLGVDPDDPIANLEGGARYLREQLDRFDGDLERALAAYNAGPGRVIRAGGIPPIRETQNYVAAIIGRLSSFSRSVN